MPRKLFLRAIATLTLFAVCISANGVVINKHFYHENLKEVSFYAKVKGRSNCQFENGSKITEREILKYGPILKKKPCSQNESIFNKVEINSDETQLVSNQTPVNYLTIQWNPNPIKPLFGTYKVKQPLFLYKNIEIPDDLNVTFGRFLI